MEDGEGLGALAEKIERLCARCDALARENARQKKENERLKGRSELAKKKLSEIVGQLPEHG